MVNKSEEVSLKSVNKKFLNHPDSLVAALLVTQERAKKKLRRVNERERDQGIEKSKLEKESSSKGH